jgi:Xaa-Pro dipeptidase
MATVDDLDGLYAAHLQRLSAVSTAALAAAGLPALVVGAGQLHYQFLDDRAYPFVANPHFKAWVPVLDAPGSWLVHEPGKAPVLLFHQPVDYWHAPPAPLAGEWARHLEVRVIHDAAAARHHVPPGAAYVGERFAGEAEFGFAAVNPPALLDRLHWARAVKSGYELACLRRAARRGARGHRAAAAAFAAGASEFETHLAYLAATGHEEAELPYGNIIAQNESAAILHYHSLRRTPPRERRSFLIDAGAAFRGYAADITRSYAATPGLYAELLAGMDALQQALCAMVVPGIEYATIHAAAHERLAELLVGLRIVRGSAEAALATGVTRTFFPHGVGHLLGLQVHDVGGHQRAPEGGVAPPPAGDPFLRLTRRLEAGTVVTIEPGVYFIGLLLEAARADGRGRSIDWDLVAELMPYGGIRIEDNVAASSAGPENLTRAAFAALDTAHDDTASAGRAA